MFPVRFFTIMFYFVTVLHLSSFALIDCAAVETDKSLKDSSVITSSPILKHLINTKTYDSDIKIANIDSRTGIHNKELQNHAYEVKKSVEINQKEKNIEENFNAGLYEMNQTRDKEITSSNRTIDLSQLIASKLTSVLKKQLQQMFAKAFPKYIVKSDSSELDSDITSESVDALSINIPNSSAKTSDKMRSSGSNKNIPTARQFVFHPYLPSDTDVMPDEKISIEDVLPVKMVKFFKSMVEDAPWEQMFMKMVRMIVDQFVDKIIEKMFAHKDDDHDKWRSSDGGSAKPTWSLAKNVLTYVVRSRRSTEGKAKSEREHDWVEKDSSSSNRVSKEDRSKTKEPTEEESWLDSVLDFLFPDDPKAVDSGKDRRKRRDANQPLQDSSSQMSGIMRSFLARYLKFHSEQLTPESMNTIVKDSIQHKTFEIESQQNSTHEDSKLSAGASASLSKNTVSDTTHDPKLTKSVDVPAKSSSRAKRSTTDDTDKDEDEERLWQATRRIRPSNRKSREDCSLRRACNAGRLLSRLPSVQDITMQLKAYGSEPHWDALLWGMTKKRCSRIFCKRQRSPKGTKHHWDGPERRLHRKGTPSSRGSRLRYMESDLTTIYPV